MIASSLSQININTKILRRQLGLYVTHLIAKANQSATFSDSTKEMVLNFLKKSKLLDDRERHIQLLEHFVNDLQKSTHIGMLDQHLDSALAYAELSNLLRVELSDVRVLLLIRRGELAQARQVLDAAWAAAKTDLLQAVLYNREGVLLKVSGMYETSQQRYEEALRLALPQNDQLLISRIYNNLGNLAHAQDHYQEAVTYYANGLQAAEKVGAACHCAPLEGGLAMTFDELGQYEEASRYHSAARTHYAEAGHLIGVVRCDLNQSLQALMRGRFADAKELAGQAFKLAQELGDTSRVAAAWHNLGRAYQIEGQYDIAAEYLLKALQRRQWLGEVFYEQHTEEQLKRLIESLEADQTSEPAQRQKVLQQCYDALEGADI